MAMVGNGTAVIKRILCGCMAAWILAFEVAAQEPTQPPGWDDWLLQLEDNSSPEQSEMILEEHQLQQESLQFKKLDLNRADRQDLQQLGLFNQTEIDALLDHRARFGPLLAWYELQAIPGFSPARLAILQAYCEVRNGHQRDSWRNSWREARHSVMSRSDFSWPLAAGYEPTRQTDGRSYYAGSPVGQRLQYRQQGLMHKSALTLAREPGELGFDRLGGHVQLQSNGRVKRLVFGDYHLQWGEGLVANTGFGAMRGTALDGYLFRGMQIKGASGAQAFGTYRGAIAQIRLSDRWHWVPWLYRMGWTSSLHALSDGNSYFNSINRSGLHRTPTERMNRNNLAVQGWGSAWQYQNGRLYLVAGLQYLQLAWPASPNRELYRQLQPTGTNRWHASFAHQYRLKRMQWQGEVAWQPQGGLALIQQWYANLPGNLQSRVAFRHIEPQFHSYLGNSLQRGSEVSNEHGWLFNLQYQAGRKVTIAAFADFYRYPWLRYRMNAPGQGTEQRLLIHWQADKHKSLSWQTRHEEFERNSSHGDWSATQSFTRYRHNLQYREQVDEHWDYSWQWGLNILHPPGLSVRKANALLLRLRYQREQWRFSAQFSFFDAPDYDNRFFFTEPDALHGAGMAQLSGAGQRLVFLVQYKQRRFDVWLRYARHQQTDRDQIGSSLDQLPGNVRNQLRLQLQWKY